jgi:hypothetical protein
MLMDDEKNEKPTSESRPERSGLSSSRAERITRAPFRFARTMPENPHHYITERDENRRGFGVEFAAFVDRINEQGATRVFKGYPYRTIAVDDHDYWLTWGQDCGTIINRKPSSEAGWDDMTGSTPDAGPRPRRTSPGD